MKKYFNRTALHYAARKLGRGLSAMGKEVCHVVYQMCILIGALMMWLGVLLGFHHLLADEEKPAEASNAVTYQKAVMQEVDVVEGEQGVPTLKGGREGKEGILRAEKIKSWDENQLYQFAETNSDELGRVVKKWDDTRPYIGPLKLTPFSCDLEDREASEPVMMVKRVVFSEDLRGKWLVKSDRFTAREKTDETVQGLVEFLPENQYREIRVNTLREEGLFEEEWVLECELKGQWIVKPERRTIVVSIDSAEIKQQQGWGDRYAKKYRNDLLQMYEVDIERFADDAMTLDVEGGPTLELVKSL